MISLTCDTPEKAIFIYFVFYACLEICSFLKIWACYAIFLIYRQWFTFFFYEMQIPIMLTYVSTTLITAFRSLEAVGRCMVYTELPAEVL